MSTARTTRSWRVLTIVLVGLAMLASCGGGVDSGGTGAPAAYASGPITGFGSVIVNGVRFDDSAASILDDDGGTLTSAQLKLGMMVRIDASAVTSTSGQPAATAFVIRIGSAIVGTVDAIDLTTNTLTVLGQSVYVTPATVFDTGLPGGLNGVTAGTTIEVFGQYDAAAHRYVATRIAPIANPAAYKLRGIVTAVDTVAKTLTMGGLTISYATNAQNALPNLVAGSLVRARLGLTPTAGVWTAIELSSADAAIPDHRGSEVFGRISAWTSSHQFSLDGVPVDASAATFPQGESGVVLGARVQVDGTTSLGVLRASTVTVEGDEDKANSDFELHGAIESVNSLSQTLSVREVTVHYSAQTQFQSGAISDIAAGRTIKVTGVLSSDGNRIEAQTIVFDSN